MAKITIYTSMWCPYCSMAKRLLQGKGADFEEIDVTMNAAKRSHMTELAGGRTSVPQIFIDDAHVGGCDELHALDAEGKLDPMLRAS
ncbi:MAG: glutaredoxin 3 [Hyphomicrobiaceae bacterium]